MSFILVSSNLVDFFNVISFFKVAIFSKFFNIVEVVKIIITNCCFIIFDFVKFVLSIEIIV